MTEKSDNFGYQENIDFALSDFSYLIPFQNNFDLFIIYLYLSITLHMWIYNVIREYLNEYKQWEETK